MKNNIKEIVWIAVDNDKNFCEFSSLALNWGQENGLDSPTSEGLKQLWFSISSAASFSEQIIAERPPAS